MNRYRITAEDRQWVDEFRQNPSGPHSPNLQRVLNVMRGSPTAGKFCLICNKPFAEWQLARMSGRRGTPPTPVGDTLLTDLAEAEWAVFRLRLAMTAWDNHANTPEYRAVTINTN